MKRTTLITAALLACFLAIPTDAQVNWRSVAGVQPANQPSPPATVVTDAILARERHVVVELNEPTTLELREKLAANGLTLQAHLGNGGFFARVATNAIQGIGLNKIAAIRDVKRVQLAWKLHPMLVRGEKPKWAIVPGPEAVQPNEASKEWVAVYVMFHADVAMRDAVAISQAHEAKIISELFTINGLVLEMPLANIQAIVGDDAVMYLEPALPPMMENNDSNRIITEANIVQAAPYGLSGAGVTVLVYDGGFAHAPHVDFQGRLFVRDASGLSTHATHVSGTVGGAGIGNPLFKGMAPGVTIESYGFQQPGGLSQGFLYTNPGDIQADYNDAINNHGADISNNSIGTNTAANGFPCSWEGDYGVTSALIDSIVGGSLGAPFRIVWANGNERGNGRCGTTYHTTAPPACAKNHITVGALNSNDDSVSYFTSWGPTDDGRLKPDISAPGCQIGGDGGVTSCSASASGYTVFCGTSMASPTVCGLSSLVLQDFRTLYPTRPDPRNSTLKVLLAHNAQDIAEPGPDYKSGYGSVRIQRTIDFLRTGNFVEEPINQGGVYRTLVVVGSAAPELRVTLAWDDAPAAPNVVGTIVNDLDIVVLDPNGTQHFPWTLGGLANPSAPAVQTAADHVNNIEQVYVAAPMAGLWTVEIRGFNVPTGPQVFSACFTPGATGDCNGNGINDLDDIANGTSQDCNHNNVPDECESAADCNNNGLRDFCDLYNGTSQDVNGNQIPDDCEPDCNGNGIPDSWDISTGTSQDCNLNQIPDSCDIASGFSNDCDSNGVPDTCQPDCNANGFTDACDILNGTSHDCDLNAVPDECQSPTDCNTNGVRDFCDIYTATSADVNGNQIPDDCEPDCNNNNIPDAWDLSTGASQDCNGNNQPDECDIAGGVSVDCDVNGVPDECQTDCNNNGVSDECDIASGVSADCDSDGVPDECQVDCNLNGIADECDIANGTSQDANGDGYPDECDRLYVNWQAIGANNGTNWQDAFLSLDDAIQEAGLNLGVREIWVATGDYPPAVSGTFAIRTGLTLYGGFLGTETSTAERDIGANTTALNGEFAAEHVVTLINYAAATALDGFFITSGLAYQDGGGGMLVQGGSPTIKNCWFFGNGGENGGAAALFNTTVTFIDSYFYYNDAQAGDGGAIRTNGVGGLTLARCEFYGNSANEGSGGLGRGGAIYNASGFALAGSNCYFDSNICWNSNLLNATQGGALANFSGNAVIESSSFYSGEANMGGAVYSSAAITIRNCLFSGNLATDPFDNGGPANVGRGGAVFGEATTTITLKSSTLAGNWAAKKGAGASMNGVFHNCILWYNEVTVPPGEVPLSVVEQQYRGSVTIRYSDVAGLLDGIPGDDPPVPGDFPGSTQNDPMFVMPPDITGGFFTPGDLHTNTGSPCVDSGENSTVSSGVLLDLDGLPRFVDDPTTADTGLGTPPIVDMGAYEYAPPPIPGDVNCDGVVNSLDATALANVLLDIDQDVCHQSGADMNGDGLIDGLDIQWWIDVSNGA